MTEELSPLTRAVRAGIATDTAEGAVVPPLYLSTNYSFAALGTPRRYDYSRSGNPTRAHLADALATLEHGAGCTVVATGMAAVTLCLEAFVPVGGRVIAPHDCYGGTWRLLTWLDRTKRLTVEWVNLTDGDATAKALATKADMVWLETPSNPLLRVTDVAAVSKLAHDAGAIVVADNTFCSPLLQQPLDLGADIVMHSATKFINGHSDVVLGAAIGKTPEHAEQLALWGNALGITAAPFDSFLALRGLRTIGVRMRAHQENAVKVVELLQSHPAVDAVYYPGLEDHPGHELAKSQQQGFGSLVSFELKGGRQAVAALVNGLECFDLAESLGGVESLICHPATMTHASMTDEARELAGISQGLVRLSVGIEPAEDLLADLRAGLDRAAG